MWGEQVALHDLCLSIRAGERFGLLGANGAGKTTTLGILTKRILATSGDALVRGVSVLDSQPESRARLGYCPQVDPLLDLLTAREQLAMFARLKVSNTFLALLITLELVLSLSQNGPHLLWSSVVYTT